MVLGVCDVENIAVQLQALGVVEPGFLERAVGETSVPGADNGLDISAQGRDYNAVVIGISNKEPA